MSRQCLTTGCKETRSTRRHHYRCRMGWDIAVTRTKETLHIIMPKKFENSYPLLSLCKELEKEKAEENKIKEAINEKTRSSEFSLPL